MMVHPQHVARAIAQIAGAVSLTQGLVAVVAMIGVTLLVILGKLDSAAAVGIYSAVLGYVFGVSSNIANKEGPK